MNKIIMKIGVVFSILVGAGCVTNESSNSEQRQVAATGKVVLSEDAVALLHKVYKYIDGKLQAEVVSGRFSATHRVPTDAEIRSLAESKVADTALAQVRSEAQAYIKVREEAYVWPEWVKSVCRKIDVVVGECVNGNHKEYAKAREAIWRLMLVSQPVVAAKVREYGCDVINTKINPRNWEDIKAEVAAKAVTFKESGKYAEGAKFFKEHTERNIRTFSVLVDRSAFGAKDELIRLGATNDLDMVVKKNLVLVEGMNKICDLRDSCSNLVEVTTIKAVKPNLEHFNAELEEYRKTLIEHNCTPENADKVIAAFRDECEFAIKSLYKDERKETKETLFPYLGTTALKRKVVALLDEKGKEFQAEEDRLQQKVVEFKATGDRLISDVKRLTEDGKFDEARSLIRDVNTEACDPALILDMYALRIGLLNSIVNPAQCRALIKEIDVKAQEYFNNEDYEGFVSYADNYPYVQDTYKEIVDSLTGVKSAMANLLIEDEGVSKLINEAEANIAKILESRGGAYSEKTDFPCLDELMKHLDALNKAILAQYYKQECCDQFCADLKNQIVAMIPKADFTPMTTREMNEALRTHFRDLVVMLYAKNTKAEPIPPVSELASMLQRKIEERNVRQEKERYRSLIAEIDAEVSFDAQIAVAEREIGKQLNSRCCACRLMNAALGEYARIMRLLKRGVDISSDDATTLLVGSVYLDQMPVFKRALELKADINGYAKRDPLKRRPILVAIECGRTAFISAIEGAGGELNCADANGDTSLHYAVRGGNLKLAKALTSTCDINARNACGETALFAAAKCNRKEMVKFLFEQFSDDAAKLAYAVILNNSKETAFRVACISNSVLVLDAFDEVGVLCEDADLAAVASMNNVVVAQWLINHGADVNGKDVMQSAFKKCVNVVNGNEEFHETETYLYLLKEGGIAPKCL